MLRAYGDAVKDTMKQVLRAIAEARQDGVRSTFRAWTSSTSAISATNWTTPESCWNLGIGSETLKKQVFKKLAFKYLCDARQEVKNRVAEEIDRQMRR